MGKGGKVKGREVRWHNENRSGEITEYERGDDFTQKPIYQRITKRLKTLVTRYDSSIPIEEKIKFVKNVAVLINTHWISNNPALFVSLHLLHCYFDI